MEALEAIHARQSTGKVRPDPVSRQDLEKILEAAAQAPNHHQVRPWRFTVFTGGGRDQLGAAMARGLLARKPDATPEMLQAEHAKALRAPVVIAVGVDKPAEPKVDETENVAAVAAAVQNLLLAAHALGLAAIWRTGPHARDLEVKSLLGLAPGQHLLGLIYLGLPFNPPAPANRPGAADRTAWVEA